MRLVATGADVFPVVLVFRRIIRRHRFQNCFLSEVVLVQNLNRVGAEDKGSLGQLRSTITRIM